MHCLTSSSIDLLMYSLFYIILFYIIITYTIPVNRQTASPLPVLTDVAGVLTIFLLTRTYHLVFFVLLVFLLFSLQYYNENRYNHS